MERFQTDGVVYIVRKQFAANRVKDLEALKQIKHLYGADTIVLDHTNDRVILADQILEATILEETINE